MHARREVEPPAEIPEADRPLFEALRRWRNDRGRREARPPYVLFTNGQLADIARTRPATREALEALRGIGTAKVREYADEILALVGTAHA